MAQATQAPNPFFSPELRVHVEQAGGTGSGSGRYLKIGPDESVRFRIMSQAALDGWEGWTEDNRPIRWPLCPKGDDFPANIKRRDNGSPDIKRFMCFIIWNYELQMFQIAQFVQKQIQAALLSYCEDPDWGHPSQYDLELSRTGTGRDTKYTLIAKPHKPVDKQVAAAYEGFYCDMTKLFDNGDPFTSDADEKMPF